MKKTKAIVIAALFAGLITVFTAYICHIPFGTSGGYIHFGDAIIYLGASVLPTPLAVVAAIIGAGLADLLTAPMWVLPTVIIKAMLCLPFVFIKHSQKKNGKVTLKAILCTSVGAVITVVGYYLAEAIMVSDFKIPLASVPFNCIQAVGSIVIFAIITYSLEKTGVMRKLFGFNIDKK